MTTMDDDRNGLASEYVLGTLDGDERAQAEALMAADPAFAETVRRWERRLGELNVLVSSVEPAPAVWDRIKAQLPVVAPGEPVRPFDAAPGRADGAEPSRSAEIVDLTQRVRRWRRLTLATGAIAACFVALMVTRDLRPDLLPAGLRPPQPALAAQYVAVFQKDEQSPAFVMSVDLEKRMLTVRQVAAERHDDKSYQVWIATQPGVAPRPLGLIQHNEDSVSATLASYDRSVINNATFGISLEPLGGSPTGQPSPGAIHARLLRIAPGQAP